MYGRKKVVLLAALGISMLTAVGCGNATQNNNASTTSNTSNRVPVPSANIAKVTEDTETSNSSVVIYNDPNFLKRSETGQYTTYFDGEIFTDTSKQLSQEERGGHSPWKASPIYFALAGTRNFTPDGNGIQQMPEGTKQFVGTYEGRKVTYTLTSSTDDTATVVESGLAYGLTIHLYKPAHHQYWYINEVKINGAG